MISTPSAYELRIEPQGWVCAAPSGVSIWKAARRAGIRLPSSCLNGTCRTCLCRLVSGQVAYSIEWPGVSVDEREEGWILPCVARPLSDLVIEAPSAWREL